MNVTANATRAGKWWAIEVPQIPGLFTQVRRLDQIDGMVRDAARTMGYEVESLTVKPVLADEESTMLSELNTARTDAKHAQEHASALTRTAIRTLRAQGLTLQDVATLVNLTPQRVSALLA